jgi:hypothetical protein
MATTTYDHVLALAEQLAPEEQVQLAAALLTRPTSPPPGIPGAQLLEMLDTLPPLDPAVLDEMERVIEEDCERIDPREW